MTNEHASALGKMGKGKPKHYTKEELDRRRARLKKAREKRWLKGYDKSEIIIGSSNS